MPIIYLVSCPLGICGSEKFSKIKAIWVTTPTLIKEKKSKKKTLMAYLGHRCISRTELHELH